MNNFVFLCALVGLVTSYPDGPPDEACEHMTPGHGVLPQMSNSPYSLKVDNAWYTEGEPITVSVNGPAFKGMMIQARKTYGGSPVGKFSKPTYEGMWIKECEWPQDTVAHNMSNEKYNPSFEWWPPKEPHGNLVFVATVVQEKLTFWTEINSETLFQNKYGDDGGDGWKVSGQYRPIAGITVLVACLAAVFL